jgi:hypothetical protein
MRKICTGPMEFTPYRPWSDERKRAHRESLEALKKAPFWTDERSQRADVMWAEGASFKKIATELGTTRSTVAGYIRRKGLQRSGPPDPTRKDPVAISEFRAAVTRSWRSARPAADRPPRLVTASPEIYQNPCAGHDFLERWVARGTWRNIGVGDWVSVYGLGASTCGRVEEVDGDLARVKWRLEGSIQAERHLPLPLCRRHDLYHVEYEHQLPPEVRNIVQTRRA